MTQRKYLLSISSAAAFGWTALLLVLFRLEPCNGPGLITLCHSVAGWSLVLFFLSAFFALTATFALLGFGLRMWFHQHEIYLDHLNVSLRQGILLTIVALASLGFLLLHALTWWSGLLLLAIVLLIELYFSQT